MKKILLAALIAGLATPGLAEIQIRNAYARSAMPGASSGAVFMTIVNTGPDVDRLIGATSDAARKVELHQTVMVDDVAQMQHMHDGLDLPVGELTVLARGGYHIMFMGLNAPFVQDEFVRLTLQFEHAGEMVIDVPVDYQALDPQGSNGALMAPMHSEDAMAEGETGDAADTDDTGETDDETPEDIIPDAEQPISD